MITRDAKPVAKLVRVDTPPDTRARFAPEQHAEWQRRVGGRRTTRWVDAALAERSMSIGTMKG